jgi:hypothetical protein
MAGALAILAGSYLVAAFANASPITQAPLRPSRPAVVEVAPPSGEAPVESGTMQAGSPENPRRFLEAVADTRLHAI